MNDSDRIRYGLYRAKQLADKRFLPEQEAKAFVLKELYDVRVERIASTLGVSSSRVYNAARDCDSRLEDMREMLTQLDSDELLTPDHCEVCGGAVQAWTLDEQGTVQCLDCADVQPDQPPSHPQQDQ